VKAFEELKKRREEFNQQQEAALLEEKIAQEEEFVRIKREIVSEIEEFKKLSQYPADYWLKFEKIYKALASEEGVFIATKEQSEENRILTYDHIAQLIDEMGKTKKQSIKETLQDQSRANRRQLELDIARENMYYPSMKKLMEKKKFDEGAWFFLIDKAKLPDYYKKWYKFLAEDQQLALQLVQAVKDAKDRMEETQKRLLKEKNSRNKMIMSVVIIPVSTFFFFQIFLFKNVSLVWGTIIPMVIIAIMIGILMDGHSIGNKIAIMVTTPIWGVIGGAILGGVFYLLSVIAIQAFVATLWVIVMVFVHLIAIFIMAVK
jgi:hypothetical protein